MHVYNDICITESSIIYVSIVDKQNFTNLQISLYNMYIQFVEIENIGKF